MARGGKRPGAGRPKGQGKFGEPTTAVRMPTRLVESVLRLSATGGYALPLFTSPVAAGFPSPADGHCDQTLDLNEHLVQQPAATFFVRVDGLSMINAGIFPDDILIVDKSLTPTHGKIVIAAVDGELTVKRLHVQGNTLKLMAENPDFGPIEIEEGNDVHIWGVVTNVIHKV